MISNYSFYQDAEKGKAVNKEDCLREIKQYKRIIIWGAGNLGSILGKCLSEHGIAVGAYWDIRFESVNECNGIPVKEPLKDIGEKNGLLVIFCITNAFVIPKLFETLSFGTRLSAYF